MGKSRRTKKKNRTHAETTTMSKSNTESDSPGVRSTIEVSTEQDTGVDQASAPIESIQAGEEVDPLLELRAERDGLMDQLLRARAEFDNYRKRVARESEALRARAAEALVHDLLTVIDNLDLALKYKDTDPGALAEGVGMVARQMHDVLGRHGLTVIESEGKPFDPEVHEAVAQVPSEEVDRDHILEEFQKGYMLGGRVLRPSKVTVSAGPAESVES